MFMMNVIAIENEKKYIIKIHLVFNRLTQLSNATNIALFLSFFLIFHSITRIHNLRSLRELFTHYIILSIR